MSLLDLSMTKAAKAELNHCSVVQDLGEGISVCDGILQVRHQHEVSGLEPHIMNGVMVNVTENSLRAKTISGIL